MNPKPHCRDSIVDVFHVCFADGFQFACHLDVLQFHSSDCLHFAIHGTSFSLLFSKLSKLLL